MDSLPRSRWVFERLLMTPVLGALVVVWALLAWFTYAERNRILDLARTQLAATVETLADFSELEHAVAVAGNARVAIGGSTSAIWRALLQYPSASIWVETDGVTTAGQSPSADSAPYLQVDAVREEIAVHAAMPRRDVLEGWQRDALERAAVTILASVVFLVFTRMLARSQKRSAKAQQEAISARQRSEQLAASGEVLEQAVVERTGELTRANGQLAQELLVRQAAEAALREHDALLNMVTKSAAELLGSHHEDSLQLVLAMVGVAVGVGRVQLFEIDSGSDGNRKTWLRHEWYAPGFYSVIEKQTVQNLDISKMPSQFLSALLNGQVTSFYVSDVPEPRRTAFEQAQMRSFLLVPVFSKQRFWGSLCIVDATIKRRVWSWAETDTLKTLADLIGVAKTSADYVRELADANMIVQNSPTILYRLRGEPKFPLIYVSHNITKFGIDPEALVGSSSWMHVLVDPQDRQKVEEAMARVLEKDAQAASIEFRLLTGDGSQRWVENRYTPVRDADGRLREVEGIIIDVTERKAAEEKIALLARNDSLTGLANRGTFTERLRQQFAASRRGASAFAVHYLDLDHFKDVNDTLGHGVGDMLLRDVAIRLLGLTRDSDLVARLGGDEFAVLQSDMGEIANAGTLAAKIQRDLSKTFLIDGNDVNISCSIGICPYEAISTGPDQMLLQADMALYRSKEEGRNQYHFHSNDLDREVLDRVLMADELRKALENAELRLYYQPQVEAMSGRIVGLEALVRWQHPDRGLLVATAFVPVAEKAGLMLAVGHWVLNECCRQLSVWSEEGLAPEVVSINLSLSQLKSGRELVRDVVDTTKIHGVSPSRLEFDVTEASLAQVTWTQNDVLTQLHLLGARIAIDDFGTEYSSFDYVRSYHVSHVKIAQSFIDEAITDPQRAATIRAIVNVARELKIGVMAEGVESQDQRALLVAAGAEAQAQGFLFSEAVDATRVGEMLRVGALKPLADTTEPPLVQALLTAGAGAR